jgi:hypothetical protein
MAADSLQQAASEMSERASLASARKPVKSTAALEFFDLDQK